MQHVEEIGQFHSRSSVPAGHRLAVILSHPTQYYSPWFRKISQRGDVELRVFYLWDFGVTSQVDHGFRTSLQWDIPLLDGYAHEFVPNVSRSPGTHHFGGLHNPALDAAISNFAPTAILLFGYGWRSNAAFLARRPLGKTPILFRGDSHRIAEGPASIKSRLKLALTGRLLRRADFFLAVGQANTDYYRSFGINDSRIAFVPHCVDNERFRQMGSAEAGHVRRAELRIPQSATVFLFAGKLEEKKRPLDVVRAFRAMNDRDAFLVMAGAGPLEEQVKSDAVGLENIRFLPFQNQSAMPGLYAAADIFVLPSVGRHETWGLAINEAMNCGCAVIASEHVGCAADLVRPGLNGWITRPGDVHSLEQAMRAATSSDQTLDEYQRSSRLIVDDYSYHVATDRLVEVLSRCEEESKS